MSENQASTTKKPRDRTAELEKRKQERAAKRDVQSPAQASPKPGEASVPRTPPKTKYEHVAFGKGARWRSEDENFYYTRVEANDDERISAYEEKGYVLAPEHEANSRRKVILKVPKKLKDTRYKRFKGVMDKLAGGGIEDHAMADVDQEDVTSQQMRSTKESFSLEELAGRMPERVSVEDYSEVEDLSDQ